MDQDYKRKRINVFSPELFPPLFIALFYLAGLALVEFSWIALIIVLAGITIYLMAVRITGRFLDTSSAQVAIREDYFERLLISLLAVFLIDLALKGFLPTPVRALIYLAIISFMFNILGRIGIRLAGIHYLGLGLVMILAYVIPSFALYGLYGTYLNRTGGLMPAFLVGIGTITTVYGLMKVASGLTVKRLGVMVAVIALAAGPLMAALIGYRAYAIIYIMPLVIQYYLERKPLPGLKTGLKAAGVVILIFAYTYFATSFTRGAMYAVAPLGAPNAPAFVVESMKKGHYTDKDMSSANPEAKSKIITRPFFTYKVFLDVIDSSYPWGKSHGKLIVSLMPGVTKGREVTISILKKPLSTSFFGLSFLEFGFAGIAIYSILLGICLATLSRLRDPKVYALVLTIIMLWLDTGPSVWWHWLPFVAAGITYAGLLFANFIKPKIANA